MSKTLEKVIEELRARAAELEGPHEEYLRIKEALGRLENGSAPARETRGSKGGPRPVRNHREAILRAFEVLGNRDDGYTVREICGYLEHHGHHIAPGTATGALYRLRAENEVEEVLSGRKHGAMAWRKV